jgi:hypothetical protein
VTVLLLVVLVISVVAIELLVPASAATGGDVVGQQDEISTQQTDGPDSLLNYGTNKENFTTVQYTGVLEAIRDWRDDSLSTLELFEMVDFFRSGETSEPPVRPAEERRWGCGEHHDSEYRHVGPT